jgi:hypothetical protein
MPQILVFAVTNCRTKNSSNPSRRFTSGLELLAEFAVSCVRDASGNHFACLLQNIAAGQPDGAASFAPARPMIKAL